jgi:hypothetical protein
MQNMMSLQPEEKPYISKHPDSLLYLQKPSVIEAVLSREQTRFFPKTGSSQSNYAGQILEFELGGDQFYDFQTSNLSFSLATKTPATDKVLSAMDVIDNINIFYNDINAEKIDDAATWGHALLYHNASEGWFNTEAKVLMGESTVKNMNSTVYTVANATESTSGTLWQTAGGTIGRTNPETFIIPLPLISGFARCKYLIPAINNRIRIIVQLAKNITDVVACSADISATAGYSDGFTVSNVSLQIDQVIVRNDYRQKVVEAMQSESGFFIPYMSMQTNTLALNASASEQNVQLPFNLTNALSLLMLCDDTGAKADTFTSATYFDGKFVARKETYGCPYFTGLRVQTQSRLYTPPDDILSFAQLYKSTEQTQTTLMDLSAPGIITYQQLKGTYAPANVLTEASYPLCMMGINLEKSVSSDDSVLNDGISSVNGNNIFYIRLRTSQAIYASGTGTMKTAIVHKRALSFSRSGCTVDS